jgi:luciferase family oxidoreductase group 1
MRLSLLDFAILSRGQPSGLAAIIGCIDTAARVEALGYYRYWLGEHHSPDVAFGAPEVLLPVIAGTTNRIRVGTGATLLSYVSPLKLAETYRLLEALFPGRIDLGLGRGRADNLASHWGLLDGRFADQDAMLSVADYEARANDVVSILMGSLPEEHALHDAVVRPAFGRSPEVWTCGAISAGAAAGRAGASFCLTLFHGRRHSADLIQSYYDRFATARHPGEAHAMIAVAGVCAETTQEAVTTRERWQHRLYIPEIVGDPEQCAEQLQSLAREYSVEDVMMLDISDTLDGRRRSCELLAAALKLPRGAEAGLSRIGA